jgi:4'-phosphopantetheinyl transferase
MTQRRLRRLLSADERERVERFHRRADRDRQAAARGWLRLVLARYAGRPASQLAFGRAACGKPYLEGDALGWLRFNVSHSEDVMRVVVADGSEVGVDLERIRPEFPITEVAAFALSVSDRERIAVQPAARRAAEFYAGWTRLEARAKAGGEGLIEGIAERSDRIFTVIDLEAGEGFAAAVAVEGELDRIRSFSIGRSSRDRRPVTIVP